jgi:hypothetical protein
VRIITRIETVAEGVALAQPIAPKLPGAPGVDGRFSLSGNPNAW